MRLVVLENGTPVGETDCRTSALYIGSRSDCAIRLDDDRIAAQQIVIYPDGDTGWMVQSLVDTEDVRINESVPDGPQPLVGGDRITAFQYVILAHEERGDSAADQPVGRTSVARMTQFVRFQLPHGSTIKKTTEPITADRAQMQSVGRAAVSLCRCETPEQFLDVALRALLEIFGCYRAWMGVRRYNYGPMEYIEGRLLNGKTADLPEIGEQLKPRVLDRGQFVLIPRVSAEEPYSVLTGPLLGPDGSLGIVTLDTGEAKRRFTIEELDLFILLLSGQGMHLHAIFQQIAEQRAAIIDGQVSVAHAIQAALTPRKLPQWDELQFGAFRAPGREKTSDIYDVVRLSNQMAAFLLARVRVAGSLPGMHMGQAQAAFRTACMHMDAPHIFLRSLNVLICDSDPEHVMDCFMGVIDPASGKLRFALGGDIGAYIIGARGEERRLGGETPPPPVGFDRKTAYDTLADNLASGETLAFFTPGVVSARSRNGEVFGRDRFVDILGDGFGQLASAMLKELLTELQNFTEGGSQPEDITMVLAHYV